MPLPLLFIGVAAATGTFGVGSTIKAGIDANKAKLINKNATEIVQESSEWLNAQRLACGRSLSQLGEEKLYVLSSSITQFLDAFQKIKNVDFKDTEGLEELKKFHIDEKDFVEMHTLVNVAGSLAGKTLLKCVPSSISLDRLRAVLWPELLEEPLQLLAHTELLRRLLVPQLERQ